MAVDGKQRRRAFGRAMRAHPGVLLGGFLGVLLVDMVVGHILDAVMDDRTASSVFVVVVAVSLGVAGEAFTRRCARPVPRR